MEDSKIRELVAAMTLEEKAGLLSGDDFWHTKPVERLSVPGIMVSDGPHGLRKQDDAADNLGINDSIKAVCFPAGCASAASFNRELLEEIGDCLGKECQAEGVATILGPGVCIKRSPLCGRNFEYFSEDPFVASSSAAAFIKGVQKNNVGTSIKHFLANSQEHRRMSSTSEIDERTLREIYLASFESAVREAKPWTVMCSYNRINGTYAAANKKFLTDILRDEWGYDGVVMSDWGAVDERVDDLAAGLDLEMPGCHGVRDKEIVKAVAEGRISEKYVDESAFRILKWVYKYEENKCPRSNWDRMEHHKKAVKAAEETIVLLKNDNVLPLAREEKVAFIGQYAVKPRYQGGGSSHINSMYVSAAMDYVKENGYDNVSFAPGFNDRLDTLNEDELKYAVELAEKSDKVVVFAGLPDSYESEGYDRRHMNLPKAQLELIDELTKVNDNVTVVLHNGSPVLMPFINKVKGVVECYLSGEGVGAATAKILFGEVNPSAKLAETFPLKLSDNPSFLYYFGEGDRTDYREGIYVGYRYYDKKEMDVLFPFGYGLSYTTFEYSDLRLSSERITDEETLKVSCKITNTGSMTGKEAVQLYVGACDGEYVLRPVKELKGYEKLELKPGETKEVSFELGKRAFAYYDVDISDWYVNDDDYEIMIGASSRDIRLCGNVRVTPVNRKPVHFTVNSTCGDIMKNEKCKQAVMDFAARYMVIFSNDDGNAGEAMSEEMVRAQVEYLPLRAVVNFSLSEVITTEQVEEFVDKLNKLANS